MKGLIYSLLFLFLSSNAYTAETVTHEGICQVTCYSPSWKREFELPLDQNTRRDLNSRCEFNGGESSYITQHPWITFVCLTSFTSPYRLRASGSDDKEAQNALINACRRLNPYDCDKIRNHLDSNYSVED